jgi:hypothetical protein
MTTAATPDHLEHYEYDAEPFTPQQLTAIAEFEKRMAGLLDCYDSIDYRAASAEWTSAETETMIRADFKGLSDWYTALDSLKSDLDLRGASCRSRTAAARFFASECIRWYAVLNTVRREACRYAFGTAGPEPEVDSGNLTFFDIHGVELDGRIAAEST